MFFESMGYKDSKNIFTWLGQEELSNVTWFFVEYYDYTMGTDQLQSDIWTRDVVLEELKRDIPEVKIRYIQPSEVEF